MSLVPSKRSVMAATDVAMCIVATVANAAVVGSGPVSGSRLLSCSSVLFSSCCCCWLLLPLATAAAAGLATAVCRDSLTFPILHYSCTAV